MATKISYMMLIKELRNAVLQGTEINGVPVLPSENSVPSSQRFVEVRLSNWMDDGIVIAIDVTNLYVVAYRNSTDSYFLRDVPDEAHDQLFRYHRPHNLSFDGSYGQLQRAAGTHRRDIHLGMTELSSVIASLSALVNERGTARGLLVCIQMIIEAARFRPIEEMVRDSFAEPSAWFNPNNYMLSLENSWGELSIAVQSATSQTSSFNRTIVLQDIHGSNFDVNTVHQIIFTLAVMKFICRNRNSHNIMQVNTSTLTRSMAPKLGSCQSCRNSKEPALFIRGRNDMCADVNGGNYNDGNSIILFPCRDNQVNQRWTFKADGTIRSNGKCLVAHEVPGNQVMIFDCDKVGGWIKMWELWSNGTIRNKFSKLVLSATSGTMRSALTVRTNVYNSSQCWLPSQNIQLPVRSIVGMNDLCLHTDGSKVLLVNCNTNERRQRWAIYPDGTIRPENRDHCLVTRYSDNLVVVSGCTGWDNERWLFENNGNIRTLFQNLVLDATQSEIIASRYNGKPNQIWYLMP
ncbi:hypothetical protein ACFE04_025530 [Oxalis oulophora]